MDYVPTWALDVWAWALDVWEYPLVRGIVITWSCLELFAAIYGKSVIQEKWKNNPKIMSYWL